jgi:hypothetical protein
MTSVRQFPVALGNEGMAMTTTHTPAVSRCFVLGG